MTGSELLAILAVAARDAVAAYLAKKAKAGVGSLLEWLDDHASMSGRERKRVEALLDERPTVFQRLRSVLDRDRRGIMLIGPSGAGKTRLMGALTQTVRDTDSLSTVEVSEASAFFAGRLVAVRDTPGKPEHGADLAREMAKHRPSVLALVVAHGYLSPVGTGEQLWLGGTRHTKHRKMGPFLRDARAEEIARIQEFTSLVSAPKPRVKHLVVVVNKMDVWLDQHTEALDYYRTDPDFQGAVRELLEKVVRPGQTPEIVTAAAEYDSFKGLPPQGGFSRETASDSVRLLKALLAALLVDGEIP